MTLSVRKGMATVLLAWWGCSASEQAPLPASVDTDAARLQGRALFLEHCALCHGFNADGHGIRQQGFDRPPADFTVRTWRERVSPTQAFEIIKHGKPQTAMPAWHVLSDEQIWQLVSYLRSVAGSAPMVSP